MYKTYYQSQIGEILLASDGENLIGLWIDNQKYYLGNLKEKLLEKENLKIFNKTKKWLDRYFNQERPKISELPLKPRGSDFRQTVWKILCEIPYGKTITYGEIAKNVAEIMGKEKMSPQAIGNAVGHNPISIIIPCHRVVGTNGNLTGYAGGIDKKIKLLEIENVNINNFFVPKNVLL